MSTMLDTSLSWKQLSQFSYNCPQQFKILLTEQQFFNAEEVVRIVPGRRVVAFGTWRDKPVVAKIFFDAKLAKKHMQREVEGFTKLKENKIPTPPLLYYGMTAEKNVYILIYQRIFHANDLQSLWFSKIDKKFIYRKMQALMLELATQHVLGIVQNDLHLKNFLITKKEVFTLDAAQVEFTNKKLDKNLSIEHLSLLLSQLGIGREEEQKNLFEFYANARGWLIKPQDFITLFLNIKKWQQIRARRYEEKIFRDSSDFVCIKNLKQLCVYQRYFGAVEFRSFLTNPEMAFNHPTTQYLKQGRSSTVIKVVLDNRELVVKRHNLKNSWHFLRRAFRETRAASAWRIAQKLCLFGIPTAKPIAFIEMRTFGLRRHSYYVTEYVRGEAALALLNAEQTNLIEKIATLLRDLAKLTITHGDLKISNILIDEALSPVLIDLDGTREHGSLSGLRRAWRQEVKRFLRNFDYEPKLQEQFRICLEKD